MTLAWNKNSETDIAGYKVHYGTTSGFYKYIVDVGNNTSCSISGLTEGTTYYLATTAYNTKNMESDLSQELVHTIAAQPPVSASDSGIQSSSSFMTSAFLAINAGGSKYVDANGTIYQADRLYSGGNTYHSATNIGDTKDDTVYQSERYGDFSYDIPVPNGNYIVTLKFAEIYWNAADRRIFDVEIQGKEVISNLDIFARVRMNSAYDVDVPVSVANGVLKIDFFIDKDSAKVSAINVKKVSPDNPYSPPETASDFMTSPFFAINAGGSKYVDAHGTIYQADRLYSGGNTYHSATNIGDTKDDTIYQTERYGDFSYDIPVPNGNYIVTLKFAEIYWSAANQRIFDVEIQGKEIIGNLDIFARVGKASALDVDVPVSVADGVLKIDFFTDKNNAKLSAIKISK